MPRGLQVVEQFIPGGKLAVAGCTADQNVTLRGKPIIKASVI